MHPVLMVSVALMILLAPLPSTIYVDVPNYEDGIASAGVRDIINGRYGDVIFATDSGISIYAADGIWRSVNARHPGETPYGTMAPLNIMVNAITLDSRGKLWIGYPNGLQFQSTTGYEAIQDQQFLKNLNINCIARWGDEIWVATGRAGLHRYHDGNWTWYKPLGPEGLGCYTITSMVVDAASDSLIIGSERDGVWVVRDRSEDITFEPIVYMRDWEFDLPTDITSDSAGNIYMTDPGNRCILKFDSSGRLLDRWEGRYNELSCFDSITVDTSGNIYGVDRCSHCVQKLSNSGDLIAAWGSYGSGEGEFRSPSGIAVDSTGNIYVSDTGNCRIQKFDGSGNFITILGSRGSGIGEFRSPVGVAVDLSDNIYVTDPENKRIQKYDASGKHLAEWRSSDSWGGRFESPTGIAVDTSGNIYVSDRERILKLDPFGNILKKWGMLGAGAGEFLPSDYKVGITVDTSDDVYVVDQDNHRVQKFDASGNLLCAWEPARPEVGEFLRPAGIAVDSAGDIYVTDSGNNRVQKFDGSGRCLAVLGSPGSADGKFWGVSDVGVDDLGNIYVADSKNHRIQKFDSSFRLLKAWGSCGSGIDEFRTPIGIAIDSAGDIYVTDSGNHRVKKFDPSGRPLAMWGTWGAGDGEFQWPEGIAVDSADNIYVADTGNYRIQKFNTSGEFLAAWGSRGLGDDRFQRPSGIAVDTSNNIYITDLDANCVKIFDSTGNFLTKWQSRDGGSVIFDHPFGIVSDPSDNIYVVNRASHFVQKFAPYHDAHKDSGIPCYTIALSFGDKVYRSEAIQGVSRVRVDPFGGVYLFNRTTVLWCAPEGGATTVLHVNDLETFPVTINDIAATSWGMLLIASDNGIYGWNGSGVDLHITSNDGIRSNVVKKIFVDAYGRCWFVVPGNVGYIPLTVGSDFIDLKPGPVQTTIVPETAAPGMADSTPIPRKAPHLKQLGLFEGVWRSFVECIDTAKGWILKI